jgi:hypothetical protein
MITRDSVRATHGLPLEVFTWKMALGLGRTQPNSMIVKAKGGHSFAFMALLCHVVWLFRLQGCLMIRISATSLDLDEGLLAVFKCKTQTL